MFRKSTLTAPAPPVELPWQIRAQNEATRKLHDLQAELEEANRLMRIFRSEHMAVIGSQLCYRCSTIDGRRKLDGEWFQLVKNRDSLLQQWNLTLQEFAEAKSHT